MRTIDYFKGHGVAVRAREGPQLAVFAARDLGDEAAAAPRNGRDHRHFAVEEAPHGGDETLRQAFHLADLVDEIERCAAARGERGFDRSVDGRNVDAVFPDPVRLRQLDVRDDDRLAVEWDQAESAPLAAYSHLFGIEPAQSLRVQLGGGSADHRGLAGAGERGDE